MQFIDILKEFGTQIIVGTFSVVVTLLVMIGIKQFKKILNIVIKPFISPLEQRLDTFSEALALYMRVLAKNPTIDTYDSEKLNDLSNKLIEFKNIDLTSKVDNVIETINDSIDNHIPDIKSFMNRKG